MAKISGNEFLRLLNQKLVQKSIIGLRLTDEKFEDVTDTVSRFKIGSSGLFDVYFYRGPYFGFETVWVGLGARSRLHFSDLLAMQSMTPIIKNDAWTERSKLTKKAFAAQKRATYTFEDLVGEKWFGRYLESTPERVDEAYDVIFDLAGVINSRRTPPWLTPLEKTALRKIRLAQAHFRQGQLERWGRQCCVTGCDVEDVLRASHIVGWAKSEPKEKVSESNGLLLTATLDALFDRHLITFNDNGQIVLSRSIIDRKIPGVDRHMSILMPLDDEQVSQLRHHRAIFYDKENDAV